MFDCEERDEGCGSVYCLDQSQYLGYLALLYSLHIAILK